MYVTFYNEEHFSVNLQKYRLGQHARKQNEEQFKENNSEFITNFERVSNK
jgi:hypothetical protein